MPPPTSVYERFPGEFSCQGIWDWDREEALSHGICLEDNPYNPNLPLWYRKAVLQYRAEHPEAPHWSVYEQEDLSPGLTAKQADAIKEVWQKIEQARIQRGQDQLKATVATH